MTAVEKVDWFCPKCNSYVSSESVTFEETHQICNTGVILEPLNQNKMEQTAVEWLEMEIQKSIIPAQKDYFKWAFEQAKEMEKEQIGYTESDMRSYALYILNNPVIEPSQWYKIYRTKS